VLQLHPNLPGTAAGHLNLVGIFDGLQVVLDFFGHPP
jgi:hypothetical protein